MQWRTKLAFMTALSVGVGCSLVLDFDLEVECWCGEEWNAQISGAHALHFDGTSFPILASKTTYRVCVSQLQHLALETADPQDPIYVALRNSLESGAIAECEAAGLQLIDAFFIGTDCASTGTGPVTTNLLHTGACWETEKYTLEDDLCPLSSECGTYYDCTEEPIVAGGDDEAGDEGLGWACDQPGV